VPAHAAETPPDAAPPSDTPEEAETSLMKTKTGPAITPSDPLVRALADMIISASRRTNLYVRRQLAAGEPIVEPCTCRVDIENERCVCAVEVPVSAAWRRAAARHVAAGASVGLPPRRRCRLCTAGEHDLAATQVIRISVAGSDREASVRVASPPTRRKRKEEERASRARAFPAGTWKEQMARIEAPDAGLEKHRERHP